MGEGMKRIAAGLLCASLFAALSQTPANAQAPTGPQTGQQPQQNPPPSQNPQSPAGQQQPPPSGGVSISVEVPLVTMEVAATTSNGDILTGLKKENFRVYEDGVPQQITNFGPSDSPITMVLVLEFGGRSYGLFGYLAKYWSQYLFANLKQQDWIALETFDMRTRIEVDFTQNKEEVLAAINHLYFPGFSESNVFDALLETTDRLKDVKGKKSIVILATGVDTFSKHNLDQTMKALRQSDVTIFCIGLGEFATVRSPNMGSLAEMTYLQAKNQLTTFSKETGGYAWFPRFDGEMPGIFSAVAGFLRNQYSISYSPSNRVRDGKFRKVKIELVAPDGSPLIVQDQKGKKLKYQVYAREGYNAPKGAD